MEDILSHAADRLSYHLHRTEMGYSERFEIDAEQFYQETGFMAPGKSVPLEMATTQHQNERETAWSAWCDKQRTTFQDDMRLAIEALRAQEKCKGVA